MKKLLLLCCVCFAYTVAAESYQITDIQYEIDGRTREYVLDKTLDIRKDIVFDSVEQLELYCEFIRQNLNNQRVLQASSLTYELGNPNEQEIIPVTLYITAEDTWNILPLPYPKYNSNTGFSLKLKVKDYNFFGSMEPLDFELVFAQEDEGTKNKIGAGIDFSIPFPLVIFDAIWETGMDLSYTFGEKKPEFSFDTGIQLSIPVSFISLRLKLQQSVQQDLDYEDTGDALYFTEYVEFGVPFTLLRTTTIFDKLILTPYTSFVFNWDTDGIKDADLVGPQTNIGYTFSTGSVNWHGNFRTGIKASVSQNFNYNFYLEKWKFFVSGELTGYYATSYVGFTGRLYTLTYYDVINKQYTGTENIGSRVRGIYDSTDYYSGQIETQAAICLNFDIPVKVFQTDWCGWGKKIFKTDMPSWFSYFDFEFQLSPFFDIALIQNRATGTLFHPKDGLYGAGLEVLVYPSKMRSIQVRGSIGFDITDELTGSSEWKNKAGPEIEFGIGLHY